MATDSTAEQRDVKSPMVLVRRVVWFLLPVLLVAAPGVIILAWSQESFSDLQSHIEAMDDHEMLIGYGYNESNYGFLKYQRLSELPRQSVVALGSSRVLAFRQEMFSSSFYNAGYTIAPLTEFREFLSRLPADAYPQVLIIGLDQWMFNSEWIGGVQKSLSRWTTNSSCSLVQGIRPIPDLYKDLIRGRLELISGNSERIAVGLNAICHHAGFRNDGSFDYGDRVTELLPKNPLDEPFDFPRNRRLAPGGQVDATALEELEHLLSFCAERDIHVVAFLPPFMDRVFDHMSASGEHQYLAEISDRVRPLLELYGCEYYEFQSMESCNSDDSEAIDGLHGGEVAYMKLLLKMLEADSLLNQHCDADRLRSDLASCPNRYCAYPL